MLNISTSTPLPTPLTLKEKLPLNDEQQKFVINSQETIQNILSGKDPRFLVILGPCSIHDTKSAKEYADRLHELSNKVSSKIFLIMRVHVEKPRTTLGWKGLLHDPFLDGSNDIASGLETARQLFLDLLDKQVPLAMEFLEVMGANYLSELIAWGSIGARTSASQPHRQLASLLSMPIGFKNSTDGDILTAAQGAFSAQFPHSFMGINEQGFVSNIHSYGNLFTHIVLRGGGGKANYDKESIAKAIEITKKTGIKKQLIIDCSHDNSYRDYRKQKEVFQEVLQQKLEGNDAIVGAMLESHLFSGNQSYSQNLKYAVSLTDPCIDWHETEKIILDAYNKLETQINCLKDLTFDNIIIKAPS
jgi:3-deoxy-7-phosphoheptulonate synthase